MSHTQLHNGDCPANPKVLGVPHPPLQQLRNRHGREGVRRDEDAVDEILSSGVKSVMKVCGLILPVCEEQGTAASLHAVKLKVRLKQRGRSDRTEP